MYIVTQLEIVKAKMLPHLNVLMYVKVKSDWK